MGVIEAVELRLKGTQGQVGDVVDFLTTPTGFKSTVSSMLTRFRINNARTLDMLIGKVE